MAIAPRKILVKGAIPLEALSLECENHGIDLNHVGCIIKLCALVYPQKYCKI
ncbi:MAG: hypothetical protein MGF17_10415 [Trichodesmium sp. MAG_R04]|nr:hypothetical protein [Trichodesmium sp. MAG_R04]